MYVCGWCVFMLFSSMSWWVGMGLCRFWFFWVVIFFSLFIFVKNWYLEGMLNLYVMNNLLLFVLVVILNWDFFCVIFCWILKSFFRLFIDFVFRNWLYSFCREEFCVVMLMNCVFIVVFCFLMEFLRILISVFCFFLIRSLYLMNVFLMVFCICFFRRFSCFEVFVRLFVWFFILFSSCLLLFLILLKFFLFLFSVLDMFMMLWFWFFLWFNIV